MDLESGTSKKMSTHPIMSTTVVPPYQFVVKFPLCYDVIYVKRL